jgi:tRNA(Leu) C34 or U34 (ribose-2'-O)-methylase TrmL
MKNDKLRGYCGIGIYNIKHEVNYGTLFRSAYAFEANFIFIIGKRFKKQCSDTTRSERHIPLFEHETLEQFYYSLPYSAQLVSVEVTENARDITDFIHPERAVYLLGPEDGSLPSEVLEKSQHIIQIPSKHCLNVAVAGSIVLYDRMLKKIVRSK